jgi:hypothetical protein
VAFDQSELDLIEATVGGLCRQGSPPEHADKLRTVYEVDGHAVNVLEERPPWRDDETEWSRTPIARFRYYRSRGEWELYWMRADGRWHYYEPVQPSRSLKMLVAVVERDVYGAFFG